MTDLGKLIKYALEKGLIKEEDLRFAFFLDASTNYYPLECKKTMTTLEEPEWPKKIKVHFKKENKNGNN